MRRAATLFALASLVLPAVASAHATLIKTVPANGSVLSSAPRQVRVVFDDTVRVGSGNTVIDNASRATVLAGRAQAHEDVLTLPLRADLPDGDYSARWSIVSDDGHREEGVLAFAVGAGRSAPRSVLGSGTPLSGSDIVLRGLFYIGVLGGAGIAAFAVLAASILGDRLRRPLAQLLFFMMLAVFLGGSGILHSAAAGTRYALVLKVAVTVALAAGAAAALAPMYMRLLPIACAGGLVLLAAPTLSGHALDRDQPRYLSVPVDLVHLASAAVWLGGLLALAIVLPRATQDDGEKLRVVRRFSKTALAAVVVLALSGLGRALTELNTVSQIWSTSYGRALIVKSALLVPLLALGWLNRTFLLGSFARLRRSVALEATILLGIVVTVAVLTELRPGTAEARRAAAAPLAAAQPATLPPVGAVVDARNMGPLAVALARQPGSATVTVLGSDGTGASGRDVRIDGKQAAACGSGCYRGGAGAGPVVVTVDGRSTTFDLPARAADARDDLREVTRAYRASRTIVFDEHLSSGTGNGIVTRFTAVAPNRLEYATRGGPSAIVIGARRWDRDRPGGRFVESPQTPIDVTQPYWTRVTNVHRIAPGVITFLDRSVPAWFRMTVRGRLPRRVHMTAAAHFMTDSYVGFDEPVAVSPPSR